jgi:hypothetical protein
LSVDPPPGANLCSGNRERAAQRAGFLLANLHVPEVVAERGAHARERALE